MHDKLRWARQDITEEWTKPDLHGDTADDFGVPDDRQWDELDQGTREEIANNYLLGTADAESFGALNLPVVDPEGDVDPSNDSLSKKGLQAADSYAMRVEGYSQSEKKQADEYANELLKRYF